MTDPFRDLLASLEDGVEIEGGEIRVDADRRRRTGAPEVVLAAGKTDQQILLAVSGLLVNEARVVISRSDVVQLDRLTEELKPHLVERTSSPGLAVVVRDFATPITSDGRVGCLTAGSSDVHVALEAVVVAKEMGCSVRTGWDVGVAGLHRLVGPLRSIMAWQPDVLVVAAGMDGVLPTIVAGLVDVPVIGLPVATGYGHGGGGEAALSTMLQSCAPGVVVVNINNGVGAGIAAGKIANRAAIARRGAL